jgi:hypothetical protein
MIPDTLPFDGPGPVQAHDYVFGVDDYDELDTSVCGSCGCGPCACDEQPFEDDAYVWGTWEADGRWRDDVVTWSQLI